MALLTLSTVWYGRAPPDAPVVGGGTITINPLPPGGPAVLARPGPTDFDYINAMGANLNINVTLVAVPDPGFEFVDWVIDGYVVLAEGPAPAPAWGSAPFVMNVVRGDSRTEPSTVIIKTEFEHTVTARFRQINFLRIYKFLDNEKDGQLYTLPIGPAQGYAIPITIQRPPRPVPPLPRVGGGSQPQDNIPVPENPADAPLGFPGYQLKYPINGVSFRITCQETKESIIRVTGRAAITGQLAEIVLPGQININLDEVFDKRAGTFIIEEIDAPFPPRIPGLGTEPGIVNPNPNLVPFPGPLAPGITAMVSTTPRRQEVIVSEGASVIVFFGNGPQRSAPVHRVSRIARGQIQERVRQVASHYIDNYPDATQATVRGLFIDDRRIQELIAGDMNVADANAMFDQIWMLKGEGVRRGADERLRQTFPRFGTPTAASSEVQINPRLRRIMREYQERFPILTNAQLLNKLNNDDRILDMLGTRIIQASDVQSAAFGGPSEELRAISNNIMAGNPAANPEQLLRIMRDNRTVQTLIGGGRIADGDIRDSLGVVSGMGRSIGLGALERGAFGNETITTMKTMLPRLRKAINAGRTELGKSAKNIAHTIQEEARGSVSNTRKEYEIAREAWEKYAEEMASLTRYDVNKARETFHKKGINLENALADIGIGYNKAMEEIERRKLARDGLKADADNAFTAMKEAAAKYEELMKNGYTATRIRKEVYEKLLSFVPGITQRVMDRFHLYDFAVQGDKGVEHKEMDLKQSGEFRNAIDEALKGEAGWLAEWWAKHTVSWITRNFGFLTLAARFAGTRVASIGDMWHLIVSNLWAFITGPWIWGMILLTIQAGFMAAYVPPDFSLGTGYSVTVFAVLSAILVALLNFVHGAKYFMEVIDHLISGAIIGYGVMMFIAALGLYGFGAGQWWGGWLYWIIVLVVWCIGVFQIYAMGGFPVLAPIVIIIMVFAWFSFGPYSGYVREIRDQVIQPVKQIGFYLQDTVTDIWLLVTNPNEYFAKQQLKAARPEKVLSFPKGIEVQRLDLVPDTVEEGGQFVIYGFVKNEGEQEARSVTAKAACVADRYLVKEQGLTEQDCRIETASLPGSKITPFAKTVLKSGDGDTYQFDFRVGMMQEQGEQKSGVWPFQYKTVTNVKKVVFNNINVSIEYEYSTSSSLLTEIATQDDVTRRQKESSQFYYQEIATAKVGPAMIGMTVGYQPLISTPVYPANKQTGIVDYAGQSIPRQAILVLTVINKRPDGYVKLEKDMDIVLNIPKSVADENTKIQCTGQRIYDAGCNPGKDCLLRIKPIDVQGTPLGILFGTNPSRNLNDVIIDNRDYKKSFAVLCRFTIADDPALQQAGSRTGVITAEIGGKDAGGNDKTGYKFVLMAEKRIAVIPAPSIGGQIPQLATQLSQCDQWFGNQQSILKGITGGVAMDKINYLADSYDTNTQQTGYDTNSYSASQNSQNTESGAIADSSLGSESISITGMAANDVSTNSQQDDYATNSLQASYDTNGVNVLDWYRQYKNDLKQVAMRFGQSNSYPALQDSQSNQQAGYDTDANFYGLAIPTVMFYEPGVEKAGHGTDGGIAGDYILKDSTDEARVVGIIVNTAQRYGIDPIVMVAIAIKESNLNPNAEGDHQGGKYCSFGLFQMNTCGGAGNGHSPEDLKKPEYNTELAGRGMKKCIGEYPDWSHAKAAVECFERPAVFYTKYVDTGGNLYNTANQKIELYGYYKNVQTAQGSQLAPEFIASSNIISADASANLITGAETGASILEAANALETSDAQSESAKITKESVISGLKEQAKTSCSTVTGKEQMSCVGNVIKNAVDSNAGLKDIIKQSILYQHCEQCFSVVDQVEAANSAGNSGRAGGGVAGAPKIVSVEEFTNNDYKKSDFYQGGDIKKIEYIALHHTGGSDINFFSYWLDQKLGCHYIVDKGGTIVQVTDESRVSACTYGMNLNSISIEIVNKGNSESDSYTGVQVGAVRDLVNYLKAKYNVPEDNIIGHGWVAKAYDYGKMCCEPCGFPNDAIGLKLKRASCEGDQNKRYDSPRLNGAIPAAQIAQAGAGNVVSGLCVQETDKLMQSAVFLKDSWRSSGVGNCGQYVWQVYKTAIERFSLEGISWSSWDPRNIRSKYLLIKADKFDRSMLMSGDIILYYQNGCDHINIVGTPDGNGNYYDIDFYAPSYDPKTTRYRYPSYLDDTGPACKQGVTHSSGMTRVYRIIPACIEETENSLISSGKIEIVESGQASGELLDQLAFEDNPSWTDTQISA
ncbi:MAG: N-acetylmuramoyl-L-alanine amidase [Candidatus Aenigmarchaeota archaeon]|nr:N-acetylmuramoyl-L-alanine amidase [Candidatus Aenigmarchaeota archaeon]